MLGENPWGMPARNDIIGTILAMRRWRIESTAARYQLEISIVLCLLLTLMPTSWLDYQTILAIPLLTGLAMAPHPRESLLPWTLLAFAAVPGVLLYANGDFYQRIHVFASFFRATIPLSLWGALIMIGVNYHKRETRSML